MAGTIAAHHHGARCKPWAWVVWPWAAVHGLYAILDLPHAGGLDPLQACEALLGEPGARPGALQLRAKEASTAERIHWLRSMGPLCRDAGVPLFVNDDQEALLAAPPGVAGIHVGQGDPGFDDLADLRARARGAGLDDPLIGISTHDPDQLRAAGQQGPSYVAYGPVQTTGTKRNPDPVVGFDGLLHACRVSSRPLVAIGGLDLEAGAEAIRLGAAMVAMIGALTDRDATQVRQRVVRAVRTLEDAAKPLELDAVAAQIPVVPPSQLQDLARWSDTIGLHVELGLPARFRPRIVDGQVAYRPCDLIDLLYVLDKQPEESWEAWAARDLPSHVEGLLVQLRRP